MNLTVPVFSDKPLEPVTVPTIEPTLPSHRDPVPGAEAEAKKIRCYRRVCERLGSGGQPSASQFGALARAGYDFIINLLPYEQNTSLPGEGEIARDSGLGYAHIPVVWTRPTLQDAHLFLSVMDEQAAQGRRVFVHCAVNMRASTYLYLWRTLRGGVDPDDAEIDLHDIWVPEGWWAEYIAKVSAAFPPQTK